MERIKIKNKDYMVIEIILFLTLNFFYLLGNYFDLAPHTITQSMIYIASGLIFITLLKLNLVIKKQTETW